MTEENVRWKGASGQAYVYSVFPLGTVFKAEPGNYSFARRNSAGQPEPTYLGEAENLKQRLNDETHEKLECAKRAGANLVCAHLTSGGKSVRVAEETDLRQAWKPRCNDQ